MRILHVQIDRQAIMHDIKVHSHLHGELLPELSPEARYTVQGSNDTGYSNIVIRAINGAWQELLDIVGGYTKRPIKPGEAHRRVREEDTEETVTATSEPELEVTLYLPANTYAHQGNAIANACHEYIRASATAMWMLNTGQSAEVYMAEAESARNNLLVALSSRSTPMRTKSFYAY